ncbi:hypothetical protein FQN57_005012 [Myotisia sp. PD_48]|nr:hypothetical protein FQN57_005012 [Myotisia sp. PD_48]
MDLAGTLIRRVARAFYETRHILVVDALFIHSVLHADDLSHLLGIPQKDVRKLCGRLREDRLIAVHSRPEIREGMTRPVNREYFYVPFYPVVDAIKFRVSRLTSKIKAQYTPNQERKEFICRRCKAEWTQLEVLSHCGPEGFECQRCGEILSTADEVEGAGADRSGHEKNSKLMAQLDSILKLLKQIDSVEIPPNDFETAWEHKVDVLRDHHTNPTRPVLAMGKNRQSIVRGIAKTDAATLEVSLTSSEAKSAEEQAQKEARKAALEKQNALPVWHTQSTVTTEAGNIKPGATVPNGIGGDTFQIDVKGQIKDEEAEDEKKKEEWTDTVAAYYAEVAREKEREGKEEATSPDEYSDDEDEEFEDVGVTPDGEGIANSHLIGTNSMLNGNGLKRELDLESGTGVSNTDLVEPTNKKVKLEPEIKKEEDDSDEDDEEFEDV